MNLSNFEIKILSLKDKIYRLSLFMFSNTLEAEDATQEVLIKLWNKRMELKHVENMQAFVLRTAKNYCLDKLRANKKDKEDDISDFDFEEKTDLSKKIEQQDLIEHIKNMINLLPDTQRIVITLRDIEGLEFEEIEEITGLTDNAIKVNLSRARKKIRDSFQNKNTL